MNLIKRCMFYSDDNLRDKCKYCYNEIINNVTLKCNHSFCKSCIYEWFETGKLYCPYCNETIKLIDEQYFEDYDENLRIIANNDVYRAEWIRYLLERCITIIERYKEMKLKSNETLDKITKYMRTTHDRYLYSYVIGYMKSFTSTNTIDELVENIYYYRDNDLVNPEQNKWRDLYVVLHTILIFSSKNISFDFTLY